MKTWFLFVGIICLLATVVSPARAEVADVIDKTRYPNIHQFFSSIDMSAFRRGPMAEADRWWCPADDPVDVPQEPMEMFLLAGVKDRVPVIRLFALMSQVLHAQGLAMCASGDTLNAAIERLNLDLGLGLPLRHLGAYAWLPQHDPQEPTKLMRLNLIYRQPYIHRFRDEILPVNLKMGYGAAVRYLDHGIEKEGYLTSMDFYVSPERTGFDNIQGMYARRRGLIGLLQAIFFFLPDDVYGMYVEHNTLVAKALITMRVPNFETTPKYQMHIRK